MSRDINDCVGELKEKIPKIIADYNEMFPDRKLFVVCTLRSLEDQLKAFIEGKSQIDGVHKFGRHNAIPGKYDKSRAVDFGVMIKGKYEGNGKYYTYLLDLARKYDLVSGIDFKQTGQSAFERLASKDFIDSAHIELKTKD